MKGEPRLRTTRLCGDDRCKAKLEPISDRHAYRCPKCGKEWDAMRTYELNYHEHWPEFLAALSEAGDER